MVLDLGAGMNLSLELTDDYGRCICITFLAKKQQPQEQEYESTEQKAREDMEQCEKLLGMHDHKDEPIDEIRQKVEEERSRIQSILKDKEYEELKKLSKKQKKNAKEIDAVFYNKRLGSQDKLRQLYDIVNRTVVENQKLKEKQLEEQGRIQEVRNEFELKLQGKCWFGVVVVDL